ncbi:(2Fe-2S)-binding protein [Leucobacter weissii]|uniref:(2Fe-2S)-binding protein n=2 Tax=Leucobacter weissii TaxID=1983706 RepID=A0A939S553_9MICO|nr:(2Fe-2S)-binding protein [Leucobacter weissii]MBO1900969.1 (2Fe-2S)-binding protein [Leucobacter weissii]
MRSAVVCPCHDVTRADIEDAIDHGHTDPETIKRATAVYMGACQGKFCSPLVQSILVERGVERVGEQRRPAARLPAAPVPLGALLAPAERARLASGESADDAPRPPRTCPGVDERDG